MSTRKRIGTYTLNSYRTPKDGPLDISTLNEVTWHGVVRRGMISIDDQNNIKITEKYKRHTKVLVLSPELLAAVIPLYIQRDYSTWATPRPKRKVV